MTLKELAGQIFDNWDKQIVEATHGTSIPPRFVAGLISNESGRDRQGHIKPEAVRFEPGVYRHLINLRDGHQREYNRLTHADVADASNDAIRALATSYGITQIMGWHCIRNLHCTIADLRNPDKHLFYAVKLLQMNNFPKSPSETRMDDEMREWNTGSEGGVTYSANYVPNAKKVRAYYAALEKNRVTRTVEERVADTAQTEPSTETPASDFVPETKTVEIPPQGAVKQSATVTVLGFAIPSFLVGIIKLLQDLISQGYVKAEDVGSAVTGFIANNTKYFLIMASLVIVAIILKRLYGWITTWIEMVIQAVPSWHNVTIRKP